MSFGKKINLLKIVSRMKIIVVPIFLFLSSLYGLENHHQKQRFQKSFIKFCFSYNNNV